jgi:hypothetical protein
MRKSTVVNLVLVNSLLALSGCRRTCERDDKKEQPDPPDNEARSTCTGGTSGHRGGALLFWGGGYGAATSSRGGTSPAPTGNVSRGGFGSTGSSVSS